MNSYSKKLEGTKLDGFKILFLKEHKSFRRMPDFQLLVLHC